MDTIKQESPTTVIGAETQQAKNQTRRKIPKWAQYAVLVLAVAILSLIATLIITRFKIKSRVFKPNPNILPHANTPVIVNVKQSASTSNPIHTNYVPKSGDLILTRFVRKLQRDPDLIDTQSSSSPSNHVAPNMSTILQFISGDKAQWTHAAIVVTDDANLNTAYIVDITRSGLAWAEWKSYVASLGTFDEVAVWPLQKPVPCVRAWFDSVSILFQSQPKYDSVGVTKRMVRRAVSRTLEEDAENEKLSITNKSQTCTSLVLSLWATHNMIELDFKKICAQHGLDAEQQDHHAVIHEGNARTVFAHELLSRQLAWNDGNGLKPCIWLKKLSKHTSLS